MFHVRFNMWLPPWAQSSLAGQQHPNQLHPARLSMPLQTWEASVLELSTCAAPHWKAWLPQKCALPPGKASFRSRVKRQLRPSRYGLRWTVKKTGQGSDNCSFAVCRLTGPRGGSKAGGKQCFIHATHLSETSSLRQTQDTERDNRPGGLRLACSFSRPLSTLRNAETLRLAASSYKTTDALSRPNAPRLLAHSLAMERSKSPIPAHSVQGRNQAAGLGKKLTAISCVICLGRF